MSLEHFGPQQVCDRGKISSKIRWYAAATKVAREEYAQHHLIRQRFETFLPRTLITRRVGGKLVDKPAAFFPGYLFVCLDVEKSGWRAINSTRGVRSLVMAGERPAALPDGFVEALRASADGHGNIDVKFELKVGDTVRITAGPLAELIGTLTRMESRQRASVMVSMLSGRVPVTIETMKLAPAA